ncbi:transcriptional regulator, TetR family [Sporobacter termitidis DSM 10068]|uniref:Transcriptional regulator, TetR family n=1 Tax=Sporobacter termitidis DSM 10068 TaxID=1123282 RepID=A0A1M5XPV6_9FIRM|nr:TetR/AcrR family transcriptional regulator [Sporobacter termitidis]SHI01875.1 transcriptional regulator, TetR family [Sporobacter termitidis DSM 10068]
MSPRNEEQNALIKDERREQILSAALKVFASKGFAATKISDIVAGGGMSHGLVYHYFKSKEEIFYELLKRAMTTSSESLLMVDKLPLPPVEKIRQTARYILKSIEDYEDTAYYFLIVVHASVMEAPDEIKGLMDISNTAVQTLAGFVREGQRTGELREGDPMGMAITFFAAIEGLAIYKLSMSNFKMPDPEILVGIIKKG